MAARITWIDLVAVLAAAVAVGLVTGKTLLAHEGTHLLNVSYDPTRELYADINQAFLAQAKAAGGPTFTIDQSHGGSSRQARAVIEGSLAADVVTLGLVSDIDTLRKRGLVAANWAERLPNHSQPYYSTIVFVVRKGNPKVIHDWPDLIHPGVEIVTPSPKSSGNGKLSALAGWGAIVTRGGSETEARAYLKTFYEHTQVLDGAARGSAVRFAIEKVGDVHLTWEAEAIREVRESHGELEIVYPPTSILAEPAVAWVDANVARHHTETESRAYLEFLFSAPAQQIIARNGYRPIDPEAHRQQAATLPDIRLFPITAIAAGWAEAQEKFFGDNGIIETVYPTSAP